MDLTVLDPFHASCHFGAECHLAHLRARNDCKVRAAPHGLEECGRGTRAPVPTDAEAGRLRERDRAVADFGDRTRETIAQRIVVGVDLQQAIAADAGEQMRRGKQADAAAEIMRAEGFAGADDVPRDTGTTLRPPHLAISGCTTLKTPSPSACVKPARLAMFSPAASGVRTFFRSNCHSCHGRSARIGSSSQARLYSANDGASSMAHSTD